MNRSILLALPLLAAACTGSAEPATATVSPTLRPRRSATATASPPPAAAGTPLVTAGPSPTPLIHVVKQGETLLGISITYGVDLADLLLSNPGVNPRFLSVGAGLVIPETGAQAAVATATPLPLQLSSVGCYPEPAGGLWCLLLASTSGGSTVEGVIALVTLSGANGQPLQTEPAYSPVNLLAPGSVLPLAAYFSDPPDFAASSAVLASALQAGELEGRYADMSVSLESEEISSDGLSAQVSGIARSTDPSDAVEFGLRLVVVALDEHGNPAGFRLWESDRADLLPEGVGFDLLVASLGPAIDELVVLAEAR